MLGVAVADDIGISGQNTGMYLNRKSLGRGLLDDIMGHIILKGFPFGKGQIGRRLQIQTCRFIL